jgi:hypothetical protein
MMKLLKIGAAALAGFLVTSGVMIGYWASGFDESECSGDECALEYAAVVTWSVVAGALIGAVCGFLTYALLRQRGRTPNRTPP